MLEAAGAMQRGLTHVGIAAAAEWGIFMSIYKFDNFSSI